MTKARKKHFHRQTIVKKGLFLFLICALVLVGIGAELSHSFPQQAHLTPVISLDRHTTHIPFPIHGFLCAGCLFFMAFAGVFLQNTWSIYVAQKYIFLPENVEIFSSRYTLTIFLRAPPSLPG